MLNRPQAARPTRFTSQLLEGAAKPIGGDAEATLQFVPRNKDRPGHPTPLQEARQIADQRWKQGKNIATQPTTS